MSGKLQDLTGRVFGKLTVQEYGEKRARASRQGTWHHFWWCTCECAPEKRWLIRHDWLLATKAPARKCPECAQIARRTHSFKHGRANTKEHNTWMKMRTRCHNPKSREYRNWGARGIYVCQRWRDSFIAFFEDMGPAPSPKHTIERVDNDGPYCKENCIWLPFELQARNTRRSRWITFQGKTQILEDWGRETGIKSITIAERLRRGWSLEAALTRPLDPRGSNQRGRQKSNDVPAPQIAVAPEPQHAVVCVDRS